MQLKTQLSFYFIKRCFVNTGKALWKLSYECSGGSKMGVRGGWCSRGLNPPFFWMINAFEEGHIVGTPPLLKMTGSAPGMDDFVQWKCQRNYKFACIDGYPVLKVPPLGFILYVLKEKLQQIHVIFSIPYIYRDQFCFQCLKLGKTSVDLEMEKLSLKTKQVRGNKIDMKLTTSS